jgi:ABC-type lipoprotein release transport system permease subunit
VPGSASNPELKTRANQVQVIGIPSQFEMLLSETNGAKKNLNQTLAPQRFQIAPDQVYLNQTLAEQLQIKTTGETVVLRFKKPSQFSREAAMSTKADAETALRLKVGRILSAEELGNFSLRANQIPPANAFVNLTALQAAVQLTNQANLMLLGGVSDKAVPAAATAETLQKQLEQKWSLADAGLELRQLQGQTWEKSAHLTPPLSPVLADGDHSRGEGVQTWIELRTPRIFLDPAAVTAATKDGPAGQLILTYLVNLITHGTNRTPYSMATAAAAPFTPAGMQDDEVLISQWLADDLQAKPGSEIAISYFQADSGSRLIEKTNLFRVRDVFSMDSPLADRNLMPDFPGISKAESTHDWDAGFPLAHTIRPKDDAYWKKYRGTPKLFLTPAAGQKLWANRFGNLTAIRFPVGAGTDATQFRTQLERKILSTLRPAQIGLTVEPVRQQALAAASQGQDFAELFVSFSFFLILAALILMALLFRFGVEQRATEAGTLLALGFRPKTVRWLFVGEGVALAFLGSLLGMAGGTWYAQFMLHGLATIWRDAVGITSLSYHASPQTWGIGLISGTCMAVFSLWLTLRKFGRQPARELLAGGMENPIRTLRSRGKVIAWVCGTTALAIIGAMLWKGDASNSGAFFGAGALLLIAGLAAASWKLARFITQPNPELSIANISVPQLAIQGSARRHGRSLATMGLLASGCFLIVSIGVFHLDSQRDAWQRTSGTGGFALIGEAALPILRDINTPEGRDFYGLTENDLREISTVMLRVRDGDDASCLNLNRAQKPRVLGVDARALAQRGAFTFAQVYKGCDPTSGWMLLNRTETERKGFKLEADEIPAIGDAASIQWALKKKMGDTIAYTDERGRSFKIRLVAGVANSILQGNLLIDENEFTRVFPDEAGHRMLLVDAPSNRVEQARSTLNRALQNTGLELSPATQRMAQLNAVQNTYLGTFQVLGGLGLLLGSAGLGIVLLRNVLERRSELGLLLALGFEKQRIFKLVLLEHAILLTAGLGIGIVAALVAVIPSLVVPGNPFPYQSLGLTLAGVLVNGFLWTWLAAWLSLQGNLVVALRSE